MHPLLSLFLRVALASLWIAAGIGKLTGGRASRAAVAAFGVVTGPAAALVGAALPWVELGLGLLLVAGLETRAAAAASAALLLLFSAAILFNLARGRRIECHCFGELGHVPISGWSVGRNAGLIAMAIGLVLFPSGYLAIDGWRRGVALRPADPRPLDFVPVLLLALTTVVLWALAAAGWELAKAVAAAEGGPAVSLPERRSLQRWMARAATLPPGGPGGAGRNGR